MLPAEVDNFPAKWVALGELEIIAQGGRTYRVDFYHTYEVVGAFSIDRKYYRGGDSEELRASIYSAYRATKVASDP